MYPILLALTQNAYTNSCVFGGSVTSHGTLNTNGWIQINLLVILASFMISALVYTIANFFPVSMRERLRGAARYEAFQGIISVIIILVLIGIAASTCQVGISLTASSASVLHAVYQDPIQYSELYIGNLMFTRGLSLFSQIYSEAVFITISADIGSTVEEIINSAISALLHAQLGGGVFGVYYGFSSALALAFIPLLVVVFGVLFVLYILLALIESTALTVIVPVAIIMRSIPFAGPRLRESADSFLAIAIGFYFILPLAILMNTYIVAWIYTPCTAAGMVCNPYNQYTNPYNLGSSPLNYLFNSQPQALASGSGLFSGVTTSDSFFTGSFSGVGGLTTGVSLMFQTLINLPQVIVGYGIDTAEYIFEGIVLIGLDLAITVGFAMGLTKGLNSVGRFMAVGPFWGNI
jgi:hypothetical protein